MLKIEQNGDVLLVSGDTYPVKDQLKGLGGKWVADKKAWSVPAAKIEAVNAIVANPAAAPAAPVVKVGDDTEVYAKASYKGKNYYVIGESHTGSHYHLTVLSGAIDFWAPASAVQLLKEYKGFKNKGVYQYQTLGKLKAFIASKFATETSAA